MPTERRRSSTMGLSPFSTPFLFMAYTVTPFWTNTGVLGMHRTIRVPGGRFWICNKPILTTSIYLTNSIYMMHNDDWKYFNAFLFGHLYARTLYCILSAKTSYIHNSDYIYKEKCQFFNHIQAKWSIFQSYISKMVDFSIIYHEDGCGQMLKYY